MPVAEVLHPRLDSNWGTGDEPLQLVLVDDHRPAAECNGHRVITCAEFLALTFASGVKCNGNVVVDDYAYIAMGAVAK